MFIIRPEYVQLYIYMNITYTPVRSILKKSICPLGILDSKENGNPIVILHQILMELWTISGSRHTSSSKRGKNSCPCKPYFFFFRRDRK